MKSRGLCLSLSLSVSRWAPRRRRLWQAQKKNVCLWGGGGRLSQCLSELVISLYGRFKAVMMKKRGGGSSLKHTSALCRLSLTISLLAEERRAARARLAVAHAHALVRLF